MPCTRSLFCIRNKRLKSEKIVWYQGKLSKHIWSFNHNHERDVLKKHSSWISDFILLLAARHPWNVMLTQHWKWGKWTEHTTVAGTWFHWAINSKLWNVLFFCIWINITMKQMKTGDPSIYTHVMRKMQSCFHPDSRDRWWQSSSWVFHGL